MPGPDPTHWLHRLTAAEWVAAAEHEVALCEAALSRRAQRPGVTHARRGAGMALNALLIRAERPSWGRSYMEHVVALADDTIAPDEVRAAAQVLKETPARPPELVQIGRPDLRALDAAKAILAWVRDQLKVNG